MSEMLSNGVLGRAPLGESELEKVRERLLKGTTTVGVKADGGVVIASDRRASAETFVASKKAKKMIQIDERSVVTISGLVADGQFLVNNLKTFSSLYRLEHGQDMPTLAKARYLALLLKSSRALIAHMIIGGVDPSGPRLFNVDFYGTMTEEEYLATGSGSPVAISVIEEGYRKGMPVDEAKRLVISAMVAAISRDSATGDGMDVAVITEEGVRFLSPKEIEELLKTAR